MRLVATLLTASLALPATALGGGDVLRQFGLASCLAQAFEGTPAGEDARRAAGGLLELGDQPFEAFEAADRLARAALAAAGPAKDGLPIATLACLRFFDSTALRELAARYRRAAPPPLDSVPPERP